jgi:hypothetical protein
MGESKKTDWDSRQMLLEQLAMDYSCSVSDLLNPENIFTAKKHLPGRRIYASDDCPLNVLCIHNKVVLSADESLVGSLADRYRKANGAWFFGFENLLDLDQWLRVRHAGIADTHQFFLPSGISQTPGHLAPVRWFEQHELEPFRGDARFREALTFVAERPDMLAIAAIRDGQIAAMAGASADSATLWQVGINVLPGYTHAGLGTYLVTLLKNEIIKRGYLPFYGTSSSHIVSQKIAIKSGFMPAWAELYTKKLNDPTKDLTDPSNRAMNESEL